MNESIFEGIVPDFTFGKLSFICVESWSVIIFLLICDMISNIFWFDYLIV